MGDDLDNVWHLVGGVQRAKTNQLLQEQAAERKRIAALPDCPHCGNKLPKVGVKVCGSCRYEVAWVGTIPCANNKDSIRALEEQIRQREELILQRNRQAEKLRTQVEQDKIRIRENNVKIKEKNKSREWKLVVRVGIPLCVLTLILFVMGVWYSNAFTGGMRTLGIMFVLLSLAMCFVVLPLAALVCKLSATDPEIAAKCPSCGRELRTEIAQQCFECGADWR